MISLCKHWPIHKWHHNLYSIHCWRAANALPSTQVQLCSKELELVISLASGSRSSAESVAVTHAGISDCCHEASIIFCYQSHLCFTPTYMLASFIALYFRLKIPQADLHHILCTQKKLCYMLINFIVCILIKNTPSWLTSSTMHTQKSVIYADQFYCMYVFWFKIHQAELHPILCMKKSVSTCLSCLYVCMPASLSLFICHCVSQAGIHPKTHYHSWQSNSSSPETVSM